MKVKLDFTNPNYIARGEDEQLDSIRVSFYNTDYYLDPEDPEKQPIPDGYTFIKELPLQEDESSQLSVIDLSFLGEFVVLNFLLNYLLGFAQSKLF